MLGLLTASVCAARTRAASSATTRATRILKAAPKDTRSPAVAVTTTSSRLWYSSTRAFPNDRTTSLSSFVYTAKAPLDYDESAVVYPEMISPSEEAAILNDLQQIFRRRRYERGHWDAVILKYKETELYNEAEQLSATSQEILQRIRQHLMDQGHVAATSASDDDSSVVPSVWLPCHAIELHPEGELRAHVDSVRFSGGLVAGLSLGTMAIMRLQPAKMTNDDDDEESKKEIQDTAPDAEDGQDGHVELLLPPRSVYALTRQSRYGYTHELLPTEAVFAGTGETVYRNENRWSVIFRDAKASD